MKIIRQNSFQTNSSSTHSLCVCSDVDTYDTIYPNEDGIITIEGGEYGWEWEKYSDSYTKASYLLTALNIYDISDLYEFSNKHPKRKMIIDVIKEHTGAKEVVFEMKKYSHVDHGMEHINQIDLLSKQVVKDFIFNRKSILYLGNDNDYNEDFYNG